MVLNLSDLATLRALVIEDNRDDYTLLVDHLESFGAEIISHRVDTEQDLRGALAKGWDVVFSDFSMPKLNGLRALEIVRDVDKNVPFIYVSGTIGENAAVKAIKSGAQNYVMKSDFGRVVPTLERELEDAMKRRKQRETDERLRKLSLAISQSADSVFITNHRGVIEYVNPAFETLTGYTYTEVQGKTPSILCSNQHDRAIYERLWSTKNSHNPYRGTMVNRRKDGTFFHVEKVITPLFDEAGSLTHFVATGRDITARIEAETARKRMYTVMEATPDLVAIIEDNGTLLYLNSAGQEFLGLDSLAELEKENLWPLLDMDTLDQLRTLIIPSALREGQWCGEIELKPAQAGRPVKPVSLIALSLQDDGGNSRYFSLVARDISERIKFEAALQYQDAHDHLTKLPNRHFLLKRLKVAMENSLRDGSLVAVVLVDVDQFKRINDSLGHVAGDELLQIIAVRLQRYFDSNETIARLGSDEFCILIEGVNRSEDVIRTLQSLLPTLKASLKIKDQEIFLNFNVGVAVFPTDDTNEADLLRHANIAMYRAKSLGSDQYQFFAPEMNVLGQETLQLETELRYAIANDEFVLHYQPQIDLKQNKIIGFEALLRWKTRDRGLVSPGDFIPLLESTGLINEVGLWLIEQACQQYHAFHAGGLEDFRISVNVSAIQLQDPEFSRKVHKLVRQYAIPKHDLELEITENIVMLNPDRAAQVMVLLNNCGVRTAIDDFGTGYSSLAYLKRFPVSVLKIDQSFIRDVISDPSDAAIVEASITLAHKLGLQVIAEGVETESQLGYLQGVDCDVVQGYFISRPLPAEQVLPFVSGL